jgi:ABC-type uncharacterized transport system substrate-binding protein
MFLSAFNAGRVMKQGRLTLMLVLLLFADAAIAEAPLAYAIYGAGGRAQDVFSSLLKAQLGNSARYDAQAPDLIVALGGDALKTACGMGVPVATTQVSHQQIEEMRLQGCDCAAVFSHADLAIQFSLQKILLPQAKKVGVLLSRETLHLLPSLQRYADATQVSLLVEEVSEVDPLPVALAKLLARVDVVIGLPDKHIFNADNARLLLMAGYRQGKPIIGPDDHWVRAGSLAAAYIPSENLIKTFVAVMTQFQRTRTLSGDQFPKSDVVFNESVAETFSIEIPDDEALRELSGDQ